MSDTSMIRLDKSRTHSECRGDRTPDDPHYRVHFWQGQKVGKNMVLLPFDAEGNLVPDDGKTAPYPGIVEGKPIMFHPLYNQAMRELLELKRQRHKSVEATEPEDDGAGSSDHSDDINLQSWLRGQARYEWPLLQGAVRKRFSLVCQNKKSMVEALVLDEKLVREDEVCADLLKYLPAKEAA